MPRGTPTEMAKSTTSHERRICARVWEARQRTFGPNGAARFARALHLYPSTYRPYESSRLPAMPVLLRISELSGLDLRWLLTGQFASGTQLAEPLPLPSRFRDALQRFAERLGRRPGATQAMTALLDILDDAADLEKHLDRPQRLSTSTRRSALRPAIPVLGRTAAGIPCFWKRPTDQPRIPANWLSNRRPASRITATIDLPADPPQPATAAAACLLEFTTPIHFGDLSVTRFLQAPALRREFPTAFALQIDGDSMAPMIAHGDFVILTPDRPARPARPAVLQLRDQMGLTCKLIRKTASRIHLIPINRSFPVTRHPAGDLLWALAVLYRVRLQTVAN